VAFARPALMDDSVPPRNESPVAGWPSEDGTHVATGNTPAPAGVCTRTISDLIVAGLSASAILKWNNGSIRVHSRPFLGALMPSPAYRAVNPRMRVLRTVSVAVPFRVSTGATPSTCRPMRNVTTPPGWWPRTCAVSVISRIGIFLTRSVVCVAARLRCGHRSTRRRSSTGGGTVRTWVAARLPTGAVQPGCVAVTR
jgi:hypothetical protein